MQQPTGTTLEMQRPSSGGIGSPLSFGRLPSETETTSKSESDRGGAAVRFRRPSRQGGTEEEGEGARAAEEGAPDG
jgi:hypothetical protein